MSESYIICEGYHDRAFWKGILTHLGCTDPGVRPNGRRARVFDPFGDPVASGNFAFQSKSGRFIRVVPAGGVTEIPFFVRNRLQESSTKALNRLIVNFDSDLNADGSPAVGTRLTHDAMRNIVGGFDAGMTTNSAGDLEVSGGAIKISLVAWQSPDPAGAGLPHQHTLERVICAAIRSSYPNRGPAVQQWLDSRPDAPLAGPKEYAWSYLAGWHADTGSYEGFCAMLWNDPAIVAELKPRLEACGIWRVASALSA